MKIIIASRSTLGHHLGGMETYVDNQIRDFKMLGHDIVLVTSPGCSADYVNYLSSINVELFYIDRNPPLKYSPHWHAQIQGVIDDLRGDVAVFHGVAGSRYKVTGQTIPITLTHGSAPLSVYNSSLGKRPLRAVASRLRSMLLNGEVQSLRKHSLVALSKFDAKWTGFATLQSKSKIVVIPPPIPIREPNREREKTVVFAGRIEAIKGIEPILRAWSTLDRAGYRLIVAGSGSDVMRLQSTFGVPGQIEFLGSLTQRELASLLSSARWLVCGGRVLESFGLAAAEALASGTPVVYPRRGALPETVGQAGIGYNSENGLKHALQSAVLLSDSDWEDYHHMALKRASDFAPESSLLSWERLLLNLRP